MGRAPVGTRSQCSGALAGRPEQARSRCGPTARQVIVQTATTKARDTRPLISRRERSEPGTLLRPLSGARRHEVEMDPNLLILLMILIVIRIG